MHQTVEHLLAAEFVTRQHIGDADAQRQANQRSPERNPQ